MTSSKPPSPKRTSPRTEHTPEIKRERAGKNASALSLSPAMFTGPCALPPRRQKAIHRESLHQHARPCKRVGGPRTRARGVCKKCVTVCPLFSGRPPPRRILRAEQPFASAAASILRRVTHGWCHRVQALIQRGLGAPLPERFRALEQLEPDGLAIPLLH